MNSNFNWNRANVSHPMFRNSQHHPGVRGQHQMMVTGADPAAPMSFSDRIAAYKQEYGNMTPMQKQVTGVAAVGSGTIGMLLGALAFWAFKHK